MSSSAETSRRWLRAPLNLQLLRGNLLKISRVLRVVLYLCCREESPYTGKSRGKTLESITTKVPIHRLYEEME
jgi:hypothetical protein